MPKRAAISATWMPAVLSKTGSEPGKVSCPDDRLFCPEPTKCNGLNDEQEPGGGGRDDLKGSGKACWAGQDF